MKKFIVFLFLIVSIYSKSQNYKYTGISLISPNKDTLWLINDDLGQLIVQSWDISYSPPENKPVILLVDKLPYIEEKNKKRYIIGN